MPLFSVIIPCFNAADTLAQTLSSLLNQSFTDYEAIILDDGSTDETLEIARAFADRYPNFRVVELENGGPSNARNLGGFVYATGSLLAFLDADDIWRSDKLLRMAEIFCKPDAPQAVYAQIGFFRQDHTNIRTSSTVLPRPLKARDLLRENNVCTMSNIVVRADAFKATGGFDSGLRYGEDVEWMVRLLAVGATIQGIDEMLVYYRTSDAGLSANLDAMHAGWCRTLESVKVLEPAVCAREIAIAEAIHLRYLARRALRVRSSRYDPLRLVMSALSKSPRGFFSEPRRGWLTLAAACADTVMPSAIRKFAAQY
ncbi:glycosyltransferase family 2 protein [Oricola sp.]|uniref:glycosyltransferase family 2 protein n=1 Tax=Oricola sp. TaxID=1979950 RepID=UPI003BAA58AB